MSESEIDPLANQSTNMGEPSTQGEGNVQLADLGMLVLNRPG